MLTLDGVGRTVAGRTLFAGLTWTLHARERVGLVGPNGSGKTSLLRIVAGLDEPDEGRLARASGLRVAYLPQEVETEIGGDAPLLEAALAAAGEIRALGDECHRLADEMAELASRAADDAGAAERLHRVSDLYGERRALFEWFGGDQIEAKARAVLGGLGFAAGDFARPVKTFSGGWRMRALMARLLLSGADLLLLDEPTNHLDLDALAWLENHLASTPAAMLVVSHDRVFLDKVANRIADLVRGRLRVTNGGYAAWVRARETDRELAEKRDLALRKDEERLNDFVERFRYKATKAAAAQERLKMLEAVREERARIEVDPSRRFRFRWPDPPPAPDLLLRLSGIRKRYGDNTVLADVDLEIRQGQRIALMGPNGAGKTTLLRIVNGDLLPDGGRREAGAGLLIGSFAQHQFEAMDGNAAVIDEAARGAAGRKPEDVRRALGTMGLGDLHVDRPVRTLSGGERARLAMARLLLRPSNLLLLDEPTNHLDLPLREALERALSEWPGTLLVVSHDRAFLDKVTNATIAVEGGVAERLDGGWAAWLDWRERRAAAAAPPESAGPAHERSREGRRQRAEALQERRRRLRPLEERVAALEAAIHAAEERLAAIDAALADPAVHADGAKMKELAQGREVAEARIAALYPEWEGAAQALHAEENS